MVVELKIVNFIEFFAKRNHFGWFMFFVVCTVNLYLRAYPAFLPQFWHEAGQKVSRQLHCEDDFSNQRDKIKAETKNIYKSLVDPYQDQYGQTYLLEVDPYGWARYVRNIVEHGFPGDVKVGYRQYDNLVNSVRGKELKDGVPFFYLSAYLFFLCSLILPIRLEVFLFYLPLFYCSIFLLVLFFFCKRFFNQTCGIFAVLIVGLSPIILQRSCAGWFDTDIINLSFLLLILWFTLEYFCPKALRRQFYTYVYYLFCYFVLVFFGMDGM